MNISIFILNISLSIIKYNWLILSDYSNSSIIYLIKKVVSNIIDLITYHFYFCVIIKKKIRKSYFFNNKIITILFDPKF